MKSPWRVVLLVLMGLQVWPEAVCAQGLEVGASEVDITPLEAVPMWGYGDRHAALSEGTLDALKATVVVIRAGRRKMAIVGLDLGQP